MLIIFLVFKINFFLKKMLNFFLKKKKIVLVKTFSNHRQFCYSIRCINIDIRTIKYATLFYRVKYIEYKSQKTIIHIPT